MSLVENYAAERRARLVRLGTRPKPRPRFEPIDPAPFYPQMWMYDLIEPSRAKPRPTTSEIKALVCQYTGVRALDAESQRISKPLVYARHLVFYLARTHTLDSYPKIGRRFGGKDHTTVMYGVSKIGRLIKSEWMVAYDIAHLEAML